MLRIWDLKKKSCGFIVEKNLEYTTLNFSISQRRISLKIGDTTKDFIKLKILQRKLSTFTNTQHSRLKLHIRLSLLDHSRLTLHIGLSLLLLVLHYFTLQYKMGSIAPYLY
jgi:hypothetical protein